MGVNGGSGTIVFAGTANLSYSGGYNGIFCDKSFVTSDNFIAYGAGSYVQAPIGKFNELTISGNEVATQLWVRQYLQELGLLS